MSNSSKHWLPAGSLTPAQQRALSVPMPPSPMTQDKHLLLLEDKLQRLAQQLTPEELSNLLEMSTEQLPELYSLAQDGLPPEQIPAALMETDSLRALLNLIDWSQPGSERPSPESESLREILEQLP